jgi:hypothetical protein
MADPAGRLRPRSVDYRMGCGSGSWPGKFQERSPKSLRKVRPMKASWDDFIRAILTMDFGGRKWEPGLAWPAKGEQDNLR